MLSNTTLDIIGFAKVYLFCIAVPEHIDPIHAIILSHRAEFTAGKAYPEVTPSFFAEFLNEKSPVPLRLLASSTCVGLRYDASHT